MTDFDVARIVPSTRDFAGAVRTQRKGLALVPVVEGDVADHVRRLDALEVRALAIRESGQPSLDAARATESTPLLLLASATDAEACQRARFYGADCVVLAAFGEHHKTVQSMRMMPAAVVTSDASAKQAIDEGARVVVLRGDLASVIAMSADIEKRVTLVAEVADVTASGLRDLAGKVDAAITPIAVHIADDFEALLDELD